MRILYLCGDPGIPVFGRKGCSTHVRETVRALRGQGHEIKLICANAGSDAAPEGFDVEVVSGPKAKWLGFDGRHWILNRRIRRALDEIGRTWRPDALYERYALYGTAGDAWARAAQIPRILELNSLMAREQRGRIKIPALARRTEHRVLRGAERLVLVSDGLRPGLAELGISGAGLIKMPMAVDLDRFHPGVDGRAIREAWNVAGRITIGYIGALTGWHGINLLYEFARALQHGGAEPFVIMMIGGEPHKVEQHRRRAAEAGLGDVLRFVGSVPYERVPGCIRACDVTLIPDATPWSSPTKLFEYMACGVPTVAPDLPPVREAIEDGSEGLLFPQRDVDAMARHTLALMRNAQWREELGSAAHRRAARDHTWSNNARQIIGLFEQMSAGKAHTQ